MSGDQEPWVIRGGLTSELQVTTYSIYSFVMELNEVDVLMYVLYLQRLIPVDRGTDLYVYKTPSVPSAQTYTIRPFRPEDLDAVYKVVLATFKDGINAADDLSLCPKLPPDL